MSSASWARRRGTRSGGIASAALVQTPAWTESAAMRVGFHDRHDEQVERHPPVDIADEVGLDDQRRVAAAAVEPGKGAIVAGRPEQGLRARAADAEPVRLAAVAAPDEVAELGQVTFVEPAQQRRAFRIGEAIGIRRHRRPQPWPVRDRRGDVAEDFVEAGAQVHAGAGIGALGLDIDHRFALLAGRLARGQGHQPAPGVPPHGDDGMDDAVDRKPVAERSRRRANRR